MERLQAAIEKARAQRETRAQMPEPTAAIIGASMPAASPEAEADWVALPEIKLDRNKMTRHRIVAFQTGQVTAPYDILRTRVIQQARANGWKRIALASPHASCGKTTTAANLAFGIGRQRGVRTIAMDLDLRRMGLTQILGDKGHVPMSDVLEGTVPFADIACRYGSNLIFGLGYGAARNPSEVLQSQTAADVLGRIQTTYAPDLMLFDLPPLSASDDNLGFLTQVDAALIVAEAERTRMTQIDVAERQVAELTNVMGVVLNKCRYNSGSHVQEDGYY